MKALELRAHRTTRSFALLGFVVATASLAGRASDPLPLALDEIQGPRVAAHLKFLAHDLLEGRAPASRGGDLAAEYIAAQFAAFGLEPAGDRGRFFQQAPIVESTVDPSFAVAAEGSLGRQTYTYPGDVVAFSGVHQDQVSTRGDVVFVGYGIVAPEYQWNDYAGADVKGKVVLVMVNDPPATAEEPDLFGGKALTYYGRWTYKFEEAARQGAAGAILIHTTESATYPWQVVQSSWSGTQYSLPIEPGQPALGMKAWVTEDAARSLARLGGQDLDALRKAAATRGARPTPLGVTVSATLTQKILRKQSPNVVAVLEGARPAQGVVYTAHYDHLGMREGQGEGDRIYNGAIDNASGVAGLLEIAQAFARAAAKPGRSIYFVATTAEEAGLLGAEYLAAHPPIPIDRIAANINVDGINVLGRTRDIVLMGAERSTLGAVAERLAKDRGRRVGPDPEPGRGYFFRSDHFPLAKAGVPAVSIGEPIEYIGKDPDFAKKARDDYNEHRYHQPGDEVDPAWDYRGAVEDLRFLAEMGWRIAADPAMPKYRADDQFARPRQK